MQNSELITDPVRSSQQAHKYLGVLGMVWVTILVINLFTALKTFYIGSTVFAITILTYPLVYIFADIFTEVYGYRVTRKIVWTGFSCMFLASLIAYCYSLIPSPTFVDSDSFNLIFRSSPIVACAVIVAFFCGELANSFVVAKMKILTNGKFLNTRLVLSTLVGQFFDNGIAFFSIFFFVGWYSFSELIPLLTFTQLPPS